MTEIIKELTSLESVPFYRPNGGNFGDMLISYSEYNFFKNNHIKFKNISSFDKNKDFTLIHGGGGGFASYWSYKQRIPIYFDNSHLKKCIIFPSSFFDCDDFLRIADERYVIFCRDRKSYNYCKSKNNVSKFILHDDMAFNANVHDLFKFKGVLNSKQVREFKLKFDQYKNENKSKKAFFLRSDKEKSDANDIQCINNFDISSLIYLKGEDITEFNATALSAEFVKAISQFDEIVTDRLHVMICAYLLNKKVKAYDNSYGKVSGVYEYSLKDKITNITTLFNQ